MEIDHNFIFSIKLSLSTLKTYMLFDTDMHFYLSCASELSDNYEKQCGMNYTEISLKFPA